MSRAVGKYKICSKCKKKKHISKFTKNKDKKDGLASYCKECSKQWRKDNVQKLQKQQREWREKNKEHCRKYRAKNKVRDRKNLIKWKKENPKKMEGYRLKHYYGISTEDYDFMYNKQQGCCAICGIHQSELKKALGVDHNHTTKKVRELLCVDCNWLLGHSKESIEILKSTIEYLKEHNGQQ